MKLLLSQSFAPLRRLCLVLVALAVIVVAFGAVAQEDENRRLEAVRTSLDQIEQLLGQGSFDDQTLIQLQGRVDAARSEVGKVTETVAPRAQAIQTRLDQLTKRLVEVRLVVNEQEVRFRDALRELRLLAPLPPR